MDLTKRSNKDSLVNVFDNFVDNFFSSSTSNSGVGMAIDFVEKDKNYLIKADLPGIDKKNVNINTYRNQLTIEATQKEEKKEKKDKMIHKERFTGRYSRSIALPDDCNVEDIKAQMKNGVLKIILPKSEEKQKKRIEIE